MTCGGARKCKQHRWHLHPWSWGENQPSPHLGSEKNPAYLRCQLQNQHCRCTGWLLFCFFSSHWCWDWHLANHRHSCGIALLLLLYHQPCCCCCITQLLVLHHPVAAVVSTCCSCCIHLLQLLHCPAVVSSCHSFCVHTGWLFLGRMRWCQCQHYLVGCWLDSLNYSLWWP